MHHWALNDADGVGGQGWEHRDHGQFSQWSAPGCGANVPNVRHNL